MTREPDVEKVLDQGVQIPRTNSTNWDIPVNENWELLNEVLKNKYSKNSSEEQTIEGAKTTVDSSFTFNELVTGTITNAKTSEKVSKDLVINEEHYNGSVEKTFELVEKTDVQNTANHIPRYTNEGHLLLPSGIEIW